MDEDCITEMAVNMKQSRQSTTALVKEVCVCICIFQHHYVVFIILYYNLYLISVRHLLKYILNYLPQWRYDHITATYLLLLSKKQRGKPVRLRPEPAVCEDSCSPLHQGLQVRFRTRASMMHCSFKAAYSWYWYIVLLWILFYFFILSLLDQKSSALQWGWRRFDCGFLGHLLRLHRWLPLGFSSTAHTPEGQRSARWNHKKRHGMWKLL